MSELRENLKKMGWNDSLIEHFVGKEFQTIRGMSFSSLPIIQTSDSNNIVVSNQYDCSSTRLVKR